MPEGFQFPYGATTLPAALPESRTDLWIPLSPLRIASGELRRGRVDVTGRLKQGVTRMAAEAELGVIARRIEEQYSDPNARRIQARLVPQADVVVGPVRGALWMLFAGVGLVLAAACANVANLLLARMTVRAHEIVTRAALGASRTRLIRQFLAESLLLSLAGGLIGAFVARAGTQLLLAVGSAKIPRAREIALDWQTFAFLALACLVVAIAFGLAPALTAARLNLQVVMRSAGHTTMGRAYARLREALVVIEVALAFLLVLGAALVMRELVRLRNEDTGMVTQNVLTMHLTPRAPAEAYYQIEQRVAQLPGVQAAGFTQLLPLQNWGWEAEFSVPGLTLQERWVAGLRYVTPGYFDALAIPLVSGRALDERDHADAQPVILVNEALVSRYLGDREPLGLETDRGTIVGVVGDVRHVSLGLPAEPEIYYAAAQNITMAPDLGMTLLVRAGAGQAIPADMIRSAVHEIHPNIAIFNTRTMEQVLRDSLWELNLYRWLIGLYAALALGLAAIGLYGVVAYTVGARTREFAVRMALGSRPGPLARHVIALGARLALIGLVLGGLGTLAAAPALERLPAALRVDAATTVSVAALVFIIAVVACALPALRVGSMQLSRALRQE
jgi:predicted permease